MISQELCEQFCISLLSCLWGWILHIVAYVFSGTGCCQEFLLMGMVHTYIVFAYGYYAFLCIRFI